MRDYILTLTLISVFCGIIHILSPAGEGGGLKGNVRLISALAVLCVALFPIGDFLIQLRDRDISFSWDAPQDSLAEEYEGELCEAMMKYSSESVAKICEKMLSEKFDIDEKDVSVVIFSSVENDNIKIERADLEIHVGAITHPPDPLKDALEDFLGVECRIIYK
jgi:hypothetical protein